MDSDHLHIPAGINFDCSGCGNCCMQWPVPLTPADVTRLVTLTMQAEDGIQNNISKLAANAESFGQFTHTLEKNAAGKCIYLTASNRCRLHEEHGASAKPSMCQLFPYSFTETPSGVYAYVSFASSGVLLNQGTPLSEQVATLEKQFALFRQLFPKADNNWSSAQLIDGVRLDWQDYLELEQDFFRALDTSSDILSALMEISRIVVARLPQTADAEKLPKLEASPKVVDQLLLQHLRRLYFPSDSKDDASLDFDHHSLMTNLVRPPQNVSILAGVGTRTLLETRLRPLPEDIEQLLARFIFSRIFAKLYFARSFAHLSLISGIHHLFFVIALILLKAKQQKLESGAVDFWAVAEMLRQMELRMSQLCFSRNSCSILETLLASPARLGRIRQLVL